MARDDDADFESIELLPAEDGRGGDDDSVPMDDGELLLTFNGLVEIEAALLGEEEEVVVVAVEVPLLGNKAEITAAPAAM